MPDAKPLPSFAFLCERLRLDPDAGSLFFKPRPPADFPSDREFLRWRSACNGKRADREYGTKGYRRIRLRIGQRSEIFAAHRVVWKMVNGRDPIPEVDHIDRNPSNNRPSNLREVSRAQNTANRKLSLRGERGIYPTKSGKFRAQVSRNQRCLYLGTFSTVDAARAAVQAAA